MKPFLRPLGLTLILMMADPSLRDSAQAGEFHATGAMNTARFEHTATLLPGGRVLVAGGYDTDWVAALAGAELYDPTTGKWAPTGSLRAARGSHTATLLPDGKVLVAGGYSREDGRLAATEIYDPATGLWRAIGAMHEAREGHSATLLPDGKVLVAGGYVASAELYDPVTETWAETGPLHEARWAHTATLLTDGTVLVSAGMYFTAEVYSPKTGIWAPPMDLEDTRWLHTATLLPNAKVLLIGGESGPEVLLALSSIETFDPADGSWVWSQADLADRPQHGRGEQTATLLVNGRVLVAGGRSSNPLFLGPIVTIGSNREYDSLTQTWLKVGNLSVPRYAHTATLLGNGQVLIAGGAVGLGSPVATAQAELYTADPLPLPPPQTTALTDVQVLANGAVQFSFTNTPGAAFHVLATTHPTLPLNYWMVLGGVIEYAPGQFRFTDSQATNYGGRFYQLKSK